jgi:hypothetical protein
MEYFELALNDAKDNIRQITENNLNNMTQGLELHGVNKGIYSFVFRSSGYIEITKRIVARYIEKSIGLTLIRFESYDAFFGYPRTSNSYIVIISDTEAEKKYMQENITNNEIHSDIKRFINMYNPSQ